MRFPASFLDPERGGIVCLVGSGGKTSLMFALADFLVGKGQRILTTTTTKIRPPRSEQSPLSVCSRDPLQWILHHSLEELPSHYTLTAEYDSHQDKLLGYSPETIDQLAKRCFFPWILEEADGAAGRPLKAPGEAEPVLCAASTHVIAVVGLDGLYVPLEENNVFRSKRFAELSGIGPSDSVSPQAVARVIASEKGLFRGRPEGSERIVFLNKAETAERFRAGQVMAQDLICRGFRVFLGSLEQGWLEEQQRSAAKEDSEKGEIRG